MAITSTETARLYLTANDYYNRATFKYADGVRRISPEHRPLTTSDRVAIHNIFKEAYLDFWRAVSLGNDNAIIPLAYCYLHGLGTKQDMKMFGILMHTYEYLSRGPNCNINRATKVLLDLAYSQDEGDYGYKAGGGGTVAIVYCVNKFLIHLTHARSTGLDSQRSNTSVANHIVTELMDKITVNDNVVLKIKEFLSHHGGLNNFLDKAGHVEEGWNELIGKCVVIERSYSSQMQGQNCSANEKDYYNIDNPGKDGNIEILGEDRTEDGDL